MARTKKIEAVVDETVKTLTKTEFELLHVALRHRMLETSLPLRSAWWKVRNWRQVRAAREQFRLAVLDATVKQTMRSVGLDPTKTYHLDAQTLTATRQDPKP